ncbi:MAG: Immunoglobulin I-set domain protein [Pedosphaera sp.]|nr:Immunoglobulin I-set domain protein [Pedosphaera sp.]
MIFALPRLIVRLSVVLLMVVGMADRAQAIPDLRFDVAWFCCPCDPDSHLCQPQFDHLNVPTANGHYLATTTDAHRAEVNANGNLLAGYYNTLTDGWTTNSGTVKAAIIDDYITSGFTTGPKPTWLILNEISSGNWPNNSTYRAWLREVVHSLKFTYGYEVILYSPFPNPAANNADWQALSADCYIAVENYLSGQEIKNNGFSVSWCQSQYQSSVTSYGNRGVPKSRLMLGEHFGQTSTNLSDGTTVTWGRNNVSYADWDNAINARSVAARNVAFPGFLSFAWYSDTMLASDADLLHFEDTYTSNSLPTSNPLTRPYIITQPQSQTAAPGGTVTFNVVRAGFASLTYQWRFNGVNLSGATTNSLTLTNVSPQNAGNYDVMLSNATGTTNSAIAILTISIPPPIAYDSFAPAVTTYAVGATLYGQTNVAGRYWSAAGPAGTNITIVTTNLSVLGLAASTGRAIQFGVSNGPSARFNLPNNITSGTIYYSFALQVTDLGALGTGGGFFAAFNNGLGGQGSPPNVIGAGVQTRLSGSGFNVGLKKAGSGSLFDSIVHAVGETVFVVGSYTFNTNSTSDDVANLWINPDPASFGNAIPPTPTLSSSTGSDFSGSAIASFVIFRRGDTSTALQPAAMLADELRIGSSWSSVTPPNLATVLPALSVNLSAAKAVLAWPTNATGFLLESSPSLAVTNTWTTVPDSVQVVGSQYTVTNSVSAGAKFYRLRK